MDNHAFCRQLLKEVMVEVKTKFNQEQIKRAWVIGSGDRYEFHGPDKFIAHFKADCIAAAEAIGWQELLEQREANHVDLLTDISLCDDPVAHRICSCPRA